MLKLNLMRIVENMENGSWELKLINTGKINQIRENHRPMKINKQLRMLMLKKEEKKNVDELLRIAAIAEIIVDHCHLERKSKVYIRSPNKTAENISETKKLAAPYNRE